MWGIIFSLWSAVCFGGSAIFVGLGLRFFSPINATILSLMASFLVVLVMSLVMEFNAFSSITLSAFLGFGAIGIINFPLGRYFNYVGIKYIGVARSVILRDSISPFIAIVLAVLFLGENPSFIVISGVICIVAGIGIVVNESYE